MTPQHQTKARDIHSAEAQRVVHLVSRYFGNLARRGGPVPAEFPQVRTLLSGVEHLAASGALSEAQEEQILRSIAASFPVDSLVHRIRSKPCGYAGDFEVIDGVLRAADELGLPDDQGCPWDRFLFALRPVAAVQLRALSAAPGATTSRWSSRSASAQLGVGSVS